MQEGSVNCIAYSITLQAKTYIVPKTATFRVSGSFSKFKRNKINLFLVCCSFKSHKKTQFKMLPWSVSGACSFEDERIIVDLPEILWRTALSKVWLRKKVYQQSELNSESEKAPLFSKPNNAYVVLKFHWTPPNRFMTCANANSFFFFAWKNRTGKHCSKKNLKNAISGPKSLHLSTWKHREQMESKEDLNSMVDHGLRTPPAPWLWSFWRHLGVNILWGQVECMQCVDLSFHYLEF